MIRTYADTTFKWIDVVGPTPGELQEMAGQYGIHEAFIADVLQSEHLPKYEPVGNTSFFIVRYFSDERDTKIDTIQGLTNKIAIFQTDSLVITIHRLEVNFVNDLKKNLTDTGQCKGTFHLLNRLIKAVFQSYEAPALLLAKEIDFFESQTFLKQNPPSVLQGVYHIKRKLEACRTLFILSKDILERVDDPEHQNPNTRDTRDLYVRMLTMFETMLNNTNQLLTLHFSISAQRTNEVIRVLTIFAVFFMPLTFIVGIYGMNFDFMPELRWKIGYPAVMILMVIVVLTIYFWFKRKNWL